MTLSDDVFLKNAGSKVNLVTAIFIGLPCDFVAGRCFGFTKIIAFYDWLTLPPICSCEVPGITQYADQFGK